MANSTPAVRLRDVVKRFPGAADAAVDGLSLDIPRGAIVALIGPSGCGKTTTLRMINRLIEPTSGRVEVEGHDTATTDPIELRLGIGYVIQAVGLFPHRTIAENIAIVPKALGWDRSRITRRVSELAELVGLEPEQLTRFPDELSGGQQQRVGVARALAADPPILLMDEPFGAVDPVVRSRLQHELLALQARLHKTIVLVTHDLDEALTVGDRVALLDRGGRLAQYAAPDDLLREPSEPFVTEFLERIGASDASLCGGSARCRWHVVRSSRPGAPAHRPARPCGRRAVSGSASSGVTSSSGGCGVTISVVRRWGRTTRSPLRACPRRLRC